MTEAQIIGTQMTEAAPLRIITTLIPFTHFIEQIGSENVSVTTLVPPGASPHSYEPKPQQLKALENADLYVSVGSGIEFELTWMDKLLEVNPDLDVLDCSQGIEFIESHEKHKGVEALRQGHKVTETQRHIDGDDDGDDEGDDEGNDDDEDGAVDNIEDNDMNIDMDPDHRDNEIGNDPHIWLSPLNAITIITNIRDKLISIDPKHKKQYLINAAAYINTLNSLVTDLTRRFMDLETRSFIVFHPSWAYFARDFNLVQIPVEIQGKEPTAKDLAAIITTAKELGITMIFASPQFNQKSAEVIAKEIGGTVVLIDPLAKDYIPNLKRVAQALQDYSREHD
ncbi:metal ABC transporter solute-binding protein, Zn/Mn family [Thermoproteota archaeon]